MKNYNSKQNYIRAIRYADSLKFKKELQELIKDIIVNDDYSDIKPIKKRSKSNKVVVNNKISYRCRINQHYDCASNSCSCNCEHKI